MSWYQKVHFAIFWIFWCKMKITQVDTSTVQMDCHPFQTNWCPISAIPSFLCQMPFLAQPSQFILAWDRHHICWLAYPVAWFNFYLIDALSCSSIWLEWNLVVSVGFLSCLRRKQHQPHLLSLILRPDFILAQWTLLSWTKEACMLDVSWLAEWISV